MPPVRCEVHGKGVGTASWLVFLHLWKHKDPRRLATIHLVQKHRGVARERKVDDVYL